MSSAATSDEVVHACRALGNMCFDNGLSAAACLYTQPFNGPLSRTTRWRRGVVASGVRRMNEVNARWVQLVPGWVTVFGLVYHLGM